MDKFEVGDKVKFASPRECTRHLVIAGVGNLFYRVFDKAQQRKYLVSRPLLNRLGVKEGI